MTVERLIKFFSCFTVPLLPLNLRRRQPRKAHLSLQETLLMHLPQLEKYSQLQKKTY